MKSDELLDAIGEAKDEYVQDVRNAKVKKMPGWAKWPSAIAACLVITIGVSLFFGGMGGSTSPETGGSAGHEEGTIFMSYAGPVFPMTLIRENRYLEASRNIDFNFSTYMKERADVEEWGNNGGGVIINDTYYLTNTANEDITISAVYPFAGDFQTRQWPIITQDGNEIHWTLNAGAYSGNFVGAGGNTSSVNLDNLTSWAEYAELLADGSYFADAFRETETMDQPVIVYRVSDLNAGTGEYDAATLCMSFKYDPEKTSIMTWGFNGAGIREDTGEEFRDFFIREGRRREDQNVKYFIVIGEDIESYELQGYQDGSCTPGEEINDASATVTRAEMSMGELLREISSIRYEAIIDNEYDGDANRYLDKHISYEMYYRALVKHFSTFGPGGTDPKERYNWGMLDDIISETAYHNRILYLCFELTIPAGESIEVNVKQFKNASFDFHCTGSDNVGIDGYDMVTSLGSNLTFTVQTASISNYDAIEIIRQNYGFDYVGGITKVDLKVSEPHYYLEIRELESKN